MTKPEENIIYLPAPKQNDPVDIDHIVKNRENLAKKTSHQAKNKKKSEKILELTEIKNNIWLSVTEAAKIGGVNSKTIRRAIQGQQIRYKITQNRYLVDLRSLVLFMHSNKKLLNKFNEYGIGQYTSDWKE